MGFHKRKTWSRNRRMKRGRYVSQFNYAGNPFPPAPSPLYQMPSQRQAPQYWELYEHLLPIYKNVEDLSYYQKFYNQHRGIDRTAKIRKFAQQCCKSQRFRAEHNQIPFEGELAGLMQQQIDDQNYWITWYREINNLD